MCLSPKMIFQVTTSLHLIEKISLNLLVKNFLHILFIFLIKMSYQNQNQLLQIFQIIIKNTPLLGFH